ncbi:hypothetical protein [Aquisalimonas sp.]|uniref:hypothetical protein n=1 Tax=Aquisalimonas sp. TaxID=1872621 RepID=UPI0025C49142|nr:hypothetical protein [Aquisalimonas sp.]
MPSCVRSLLLLSLLMPSLAGAFDCDELLATARGAEQLQARTHGLERAYVNDCLGGDKDTWPPARMLAFELNLNQFATVAGLRSAASQVAERIAGDARNAGGNAATAQLRGWFEAVSKNADRVGARLAGQQGLNRPPARMDHWQVAFDPTGRWMLPVIDDDDIGAEALRPACRAPGPQCDAVTEDVILLLRQVKLMERVVNLSVERPATENLHQRLRVHHRQWTAYLTEARSQMPWELAFNAWRYRAARDHYCDTPGGMCGAPESQWILLHPGVALEYLQGQESGERVEPALTLELVGYNRWSWRNDGSIGRGLGASLVTTASDRSGKSVLGYGVMFHLNHRISVGVTQRGDETAFFVGYDLWRTAPGRVDPLRDRFRGQ